MGPRRIDFETMRIGVANNVQPVLGPSFTITRTGKYVLDPLGPCFGPFVLAKLFDLFGGRREPQHVEKQPPKERASIRGRAR